jgi:hypothetical protein
MKEPPKPGTRPNPWSNSVIGDFTPEEHAAHTAQPGVNYFENMTTRKATGLLNKLASRFAKPKAVLAHKPQPKRKKHDD